MRDPQGSLRDPFGRPSLESAADKALNDDLAFAAGLLPPRGAGRLAYGGKRRAGEAPRGSLSSHPAVQYGLPGLLAGALLTLFLFGNPCGGAAAGGADVGGVDVAAGAAAPAAAAPRRKKKVIWSGPAPPPGAELKMVLVVRADLKMSVGKTAAQCAHASLGLYQKLAGTRDALLRAWEECGQTKGASLALKCNSMEELVALVGKAEAAGLPLYRVVDAGRTEVEPGTTTVLAIGPGVVDAVNSVTGDLSLLR